MTQVAINAARGGSGNSYSLAKSEEKAFWVMIILHKERLELEMPILPVTRIALPQADQISHRIELLPATSFMIITSKCVKINTEDILATGDENMPSIRQIINEVFDIGSLWKRQRSVQEYNWEKVRNVDFQHIYREKNELLKLMLRCVCVACPDLDLHYASTHYERTLMQQIAELDHAISDQSLELLPDYHQRVQVLKDRSFVDLAGVVLLKGRVACEINTADELLLTELILDNFFGDYEPVFIFYIGGDSGAAFMLCISR